MSLNNTRFFPTGRPRTGRIQLRWRVVLFTAAWLAGALPAAGCARAPESGIPTLPPASPTMTGAAPTGTVPPPVSSPIPAAATAVPSPQGEPDPEPTAAAASPAAPATASAEVNPRNGIETPPAVCAPLADLAWDEIEDHLTNPYYLPAPGSDLPHQGIDLADFFEGSRVAAPGRTVQAVLSGTVNTVLADVFPYGSAVLVETLLADLPGLPLPEAIPPDELPWNTPLTCPAVYPQPGAEAPLSLYLLYAHMADPPELEAGRGLTCGAPLGAIGDSGNALNPHLHLEARIGPSGGSFEGMGHYDPSASEGAMAAYCLWRVSGWYRAIDPMLVLGLIE